MDPSTDPSAHVLRARRTAAVARAVLGLCGAGLTLADPKLAAHTALTAAGFAVIFATAVVQLIAPRLNWLKVEESLAASAGVLIIGLGDQRVTVLSVLWLSALASGVLARGGRVHWLGRAVLLAALVLPVVRWQRLSAEHAGLSLAAIALLLTCGRLTRELRHLLSQAREDADHDSLTGGLSRGAFRAALARSAETAASGALLLVDLDDFGQVNKSQGHAAGDSLLVSVFARIQDVVGPDRPIGRLGGDEFAAFVQDADPTGLARRLVEELDRPGEGGQAVAACVGIAQAPRDGRDADALLRASDVALRVAKRTGKRQVSVYAGASLADDGPDGARGALERLIAGDGLAMVVQPIVDLHDGSIHAYEALARFGVPGNDSPLQWLALADECGVRDDVELACLRAALALFAERPRGSLLSVNLSGTLLLDARTQDLLGAQPDVDGLIVEITEDALVEDGVALRSAIAALQGRGVSFAVDDMGAGYSGLLQITTLRPRYLKLDRALIRDIDTDADRRALVAAMLGYAHQTGGHLVAEGVETAAELDALTRLGVGLAQGYHLGRPAPPWPLVTPRAPSVVTRVDRAPSAVDRAVGVAN